MKEKNLSPDRRLVRRRLLDSLDELVSKTLDTLSKVIVGLGGPIGAVSTRDGIFAGKGDIENIVLVVPGVSVDASSEASCRQRDCSLSHKSLGGIIAICITPNTIDLDVCLITTDNSHQAEGFDSVVLGSEVLIACSRSLITEDNIRVDKGVEVPDALVVPPNSILEGGLRLGIA
ncbi:hypothetical protein HG530_008038 [Fusarium avenaceum]|nr:hypothetical protein HG530_008038 [Fusarium avenaceum]